LNTRRMDTGKKGEEIARDFLKKQVFIILETNYRCAEGEIDTVARQNDCLVFTEVRTKTNRQFGTP